MKRVLIFGGTFNPVHDGHVRLCQTLSREIGTDFVLVIPTFLPVHKEVTIDFASANDRINMCKIAFSNIPNCEISDLEIRKNHACYSVDTIREIKSLYPDAELYFACGSDMFLSLDTWKDTKTLFSLATFCAVPRKDEYLAMSKKAEQLSKVGLQYQIFDCDFLEVSSSEIRQCIKSGEEPAHLNAEVYAYIKENNIYGG